MKETKFKTLDGCEAAARIAYRLNEVIVIYPITPSSQMGEWADAWSATGVRNVWGIVPSVTEMQSEGGAAGSIHGALQTGSLSTTFTASQGLLLMIPNMYKIAGELTPTVFHVAARSIAAQALSIFGDHSDVMAARGTGWAMLCSASVQEAQDFALIAQAATLESRIPFLHFFDGFRTSHETSKIEVLPDEVLLKMVSEDRVVEHRARALSPDHPVIRGTAQNPDVYFQARETVNPYYARCPEIVQQTMDRFGKETGRFYRLFEYYGAPDADRIIVLMGSGCEAVHETVDYLNSNGEKVGVVKIRLYRPFDAKRFCESLPATAKSLAILDRTKEPGSSGEPLYLDCIQAIFEGASEHWGTLDRLPKVVGGRFGLSSKEFTPAMIKAVFDNLNLSSPKNHFTVGIVDDLSHTSLDFDPNFRTGVTDRFSAVFYGLGSDGTVGANKDSIKIIGEYTSHYAQGYFVYDSKKSGAVTISHLRFGPKPIRSTYLISRADFVGCHQPHFIEQFNLAKDLVQGGILLLNSPLGADKIWNILPEETQRDLIKKQARLYVIDAHRVALECGMRGRINTVMQVCFFSVSGVLPRDKAIAAIKDSIRKTYGRKGEEIVRMNLEAVDKAESHLCEVKIGEIQNSVSSSKSVEVSRHDEKAEKPINQPGRIKPPVPQEAPEFVRTVLGPIIAGRGDELPVSVLPADGTYPVGTTRWEKRNLTDEIPVWDSAICIQCGKCVLVCPHAAIRSKVFPPNILEKAPQTFKACDARAPDWKDLKYSLQITPEDCTGCAICVDVCPVRNKSQAKLKAINMESQAPILEAERQNWDFFLTIPEFDRRRIGLSLVRDQQIREPLFEFSGACAGCGETPYLKLLTQLFGDRMIVANATGCSSIYGGNLPTTPWAKNAEGRGPAWSNSLFEDNAEFGLGFRISLDKQLDIATYILRQLAPQIGDDLVGEILNSDQKDEAGIFDQRRAVDDLKKRLREINSPESNRLLAVADSLVKKSIWIVGGDGWGYDIGYGGLDHVLSTGRKVRVLLLDTEVYSNTGGQCSKSTPKAAVAKFASGGKTARKKDLGLIAMTYGSVYVASVAMGAKDDQTLKAFREADSFDGPALIIAYSHCIAHGINMTTAMQNQKAAVQSGQWLLYRYNPERQRQGMNPLQIDCPKPKIAVEKYLNLENRFKMLIKGKPNEARRLFAEAQSDADDRWALYQYLAARTFEASSPQTNSTEPQPVQTCLAHP